MTTHHLNNNNNTTIPTPENTHAGMVRTINPSQGETILELILPFLGELELALVSMTNKRILDLHWKYMYNIVVQNYPPFQLEGPRPSVEQMDKAVMYLPPRIVVVPDYEPDNFGPGNNAFPVPLSGQPEVHYDPRHTMDTFESLSLMDKTKALKKYGAKVETWYSSLTAHRAEEQETFMHTIFAIIEAANMLPRDPMARDALLLLNRADDLFRDLNNYPFFLQCLNEHEATMVKLCFFEKVINETVDHRPHCGNARQLMMCLQCLGIPLTSSHVRPFLARNMRCICSHH